MLIEVLGYLFLGGFVGFLAGLLGIGGGLILVPVLVQIFANKGLAVDVSAKLAIGTSLATIIATGTSAMWAHHCLNAVLWSAWRKLSVAILVGCIIGAGLARVIKGEWLVLCVGVFALLAGIKMGLQWKPAPHERALSRLSWYSAGGIIGAVSSLIGIGGGTLTVPFLVWNQVPIQKAIATSSATGLLIGGMGTLCFLVNGWSDPELPPYSFGWIYGPAVLAVSVSSVYFATLGARCTHRLPVPIIKRVFSVLLLIISARMLFFTE